MKNRTLIIRSLLGICWLISVSCQPETSIDVSDIELNTRYQRFDSAFFECDTSQFNESLLELKQAYPNFFLNGGTNHFWFTQRTEPLQQALYRASKKKLGNWPARNHRLNAAFKRYYALFGKEDTFRVYTYISRLDFGYPVLWSDQLCFVASDLYLGKASKYYAAMPQYLAFERQEKFMLRDILEPLLIAQSSPLPESPTLLESMLYWGKIYYLLEQLLPESKPYEVLKMPSEKLAFARDKEREMWIYFIENQLLFSNRSDLQMRFIETAPFSKFRTKIDLKTPGRIGRWFGYQIVKAYFHQHPEQDPARFLENKIEAQAILQASRYKP